ncbi:capsule chain length determinant protein [Clostridium bornimense]|uniref:Capsule chain length determinant protein n=1 Tax=Clostridium bornimense TaxID=1216932 RepID=W6S0Y0_9CLOT|nr:Wzz/FepE/Etk N-terminal domain-containing protein [Clostridium bornimense]CDM67932.1 capsule chain length determinant protein [Clostridium bornimense]
MKDTILDKTINIEELIFIIKRRYKLIVSMMILIGGISATLSFFVIKPKYEVSTKIFVGKAEQEEKYNNSDVQMYQQLIKTYSETIKTKDLVGNAIKNVNTMKTTGQVLANITVTPIANTQILQIKYKDDNSKEAKEILSAVTNEFINTSKTLVANGNVKIIESVEEPRVPVTPKKFLNISMGIVIGLLAGLGISILLETMDRTFKDREEIEKIIGIPVLGVIPSEEFTKRRR